MVSSLTLPILGLFVAYHTLVQAAETPAPRVKLIATYGRNGPVRVDSKYSPGEMVALSASFQNVVATDDSDIDVTLQIEGYRGQDRLERASTQRFLKKQDLVRAAAELPSVLPMRLEAGAHRVTLRITDNTTGASALAEYSFEVLIPRFGPRSVVFASDEALQYIQGSHLASHRTYYLEVEVDGFQQIRGRANMVALLDVLDITGKSIRKSPYRFPIAGAFPDGVNPTVTFTVPSGKPGKYVVDIKFEDLIASASARLRLPIVVHDDSFVQARINH